MYTRKISEMPETFVKNNKPVFGTFLGHPKRLDIRGIFRPYGVIPLPTFITNLRIKSRITYIFNIGEYIGSINLQDAKICSFSQIIFWNTTTNQKFAYRSILGPRKRFIPHNLENATTSTHSKKRFIRFFWDRSINKFSILFNLKGNIVRPTANGILFSNFNAPDFSEITTSIPFPTTRRCSVSYKASMKLHGSINLKYPNQQEKLYSQPEGLGLFEIDRSYMKFRSNGEYLVGIGSVNNKPVIFRVNKSVSEDVDAERINKNILFYEGRTIPLPPVVITHHYGLNNQWIIQDTENMVDLTFTPLSSNINKLSVFFFRTIYTSLYGTFEGTLLTDTGEKITFKNLTGLAEKYLIRL